MKNTCDTRNRVVAIFRQVSHECLVMVSLPVRKLDYDPWTASHVIAVNWTLPIPYILSSFEPKRERQFGAFSLVPGVSQRA